MQLDWCVGELMKTLDRLDLAEKTLVIFCSDNGPVMDDGYKDGALEQLGAHRAAGALTGGKYSVYEGGTRTPLITRWKGKVEPGLSDNVVCTIDFAASLAAMTGQDLADDACVDSINLLDAFLGNANATGRDELVQQDNGNNGTFGLRVGDWKLHKYGNNKANNTVVEQTLTRTKMPDFLLFNLKDDPAEKTNVLKDNPKVAEEMKQRLEKIIADGRTRPVAVEPAAAR